jgi:hypothetical protein
MNWLEEQKIKLDAEKRRLAEKQALEKERDERARVRAEVRAKQFADKFFIPLDGKKTKLGKFSYRLNRNILEFYAGDYQLGAIRFYTTPQYNSYDQDSGEPSGGIKCYYDSASIDYHAADGQRPRYGQPFYENSELQQTQLAKYLLEFIEL